MGGKNVPSNMARLTLREHFICHWLLYKFSEGNDKFKMGHAFGLMRYSSKLRHPGGRYTSSRGFEAAKTAHKESMLMYWTDERKADLSASMMGNKLSEETKQKISKAVMGRPAPNKGKPMSAESKAKSSATKMGLYTSPYDYKVIDDKGNVHIVLDTGVKRWFIDNHGRFSDTLKKYRATGDVVLRGKWKGWQILKFPKGQL